MSKPVTYKNTDDLLKKANAGKAVVPNYPMKGIIDLCREWIMDGWGLEDEPTPAQIAAALYNEAADQELCVLEGTSHESYPTALRDLGHLILQAWATDSRDEALGVSSRKNSYKLLPRFFAVYHQYEQLHGSKIELARIIHPLTEDNETEQPAFDVRFIGTHVVVRAHPEEVLESTNGIPQIVGLGGKMVRKGAKLYAKKACVTLTDAELAKLPKYPRSSSRQFRFSKQCQQ